MAVLVVAVIGAAAGTYFAVRGGGTKKVAVHGTITLTDPEGYIGHNLGLGDSGSGTSYGPSSPADTSCYGESGYSDISEGADVVISDDGGRTLVITHLSAGQSGALGCTFSFEAKVPAGKKFYGVTVTHRGTIKEQEKDLEHVALSLGN